MFQHLLQAESTNQGNLLNTKTKTDLNGPL